MTDPTYVTEVAALEKGLAGHVYPGEVMTALDEAWFNCSCGDRVLVPVVDLAISSEGLRDAYSTHVAQALIAEGVVRSGATDHQRGVEAAVAAIADTLDLAEITGNDWRSTLETLKAACVEQARDWRAEVRAAFSESNQHFEREYDHAVAENSHLRAALASVHQRVAESAARFDRFADDTIRAEDVELYRVVANELRSAIADPPNAEARDRLGEVRDLMACAWDEGFMDAARQDHPAYPRKRRMTNPYRSGGDS